MDPLFRLGDRSGKEAVGSGKNSLPRPAAPALLFLSGERTGKEVVVNRR